MSNKSSGNVEKFGWDPGNGVQKAAWTNGKINVVAFPSVVGVGRLDTGAVTLGGFEMAQNKQDLPYVIELGGLRYLAGQNVATYAKPIERLDTGRFTDGVELRALFCLTVGLLGLNGMQVAAAVGLPVEMLRDKAHAQAVSKQMAGWMVGQHRFSMNGQEMGFEVTMIRCTSQPLGAWLDWGMNDEGKWVKGPEGRKSPTLIIDQGFNTLDLFAVEGGQPSPRYTGGQELGMGRALEMAASLVEERYRVRLSLHEIDGLMREHLAGEKARTYHRGDLVDISAEINQALSGLAVDVLEFIRKKVGGSAESFRIILAGGGAVALHKWLSAEYPHAELAPAPALANARGLAKLAVSGFLG